MSMTRSEARDTQTEFEASLFNKLSLAYVFNKLGDEFNGPSGQVNSWTVPGLLSLLQLHLLHLRRQHVDGRRRPHPWPHEVVVGHDHA